MKSRNLLLSFIAALTLCWANLTLADDVPDEMPMAQVTVNINDADATTLAEVLDGVGISRAEAIVSYREKHGKFYSAEDGARAPDRRSPRQRAFSSCARHSEMTSVATASMNLRSCSMKIIVG